MLRSLSSRAALAAALLVTAAHARDAHACGGGMFYPVSDQETVSVEGHAVVVSISKTRTVLWDRITYRGAPADFAWVMPVGPGAELQAASAAWMDAIIGGTAPVVLSPAAECDEGGGDYSSGGCCGSALDGGGGEFSNREVGGSREVVTVVSRKDVGPYESVTIKSDVPGAIGQWLTDNGYAIPTSMTPVLDGYAAQGLEFIAVKLKPGADVSQMTPVRVVMQGGLTTFPMKMLAAGANAKVPISLAVIAEGRYEAKGFGNVRVDPSAVKWDFDAGKSNYAGVRSALLAQNGGATWLTGAALDKGLVTPAREPFSRPGGSEASSLATLYFESLPEYCASAAESMMNKQGEVVEVCAEATMPCGQLQVGQINSAVYKCAGLDDLATALVGMRAESVWVTRLDAELPVSALSQDLTIVPTTPQAVPSHQVVASEFTGDPCNAEALVRLERAPKKRLPRAPIGAMAFAVALAFARKASRKRRG